MRKMFIPFVVILISLFLILPSSTDAGLKKVGQSGLKFLSNPVGARAMAMGNSYMGVAYDATAMFSKPALMARMETSDMFFDYHKGIADINQYAGSFATALNEGEWGVIGMSFRIMDYGEFHGTRRADATIEGTEYVDMKTYSPTGLSVGLGYAKTISSFFGVGGQIKVVHQAANAGWMGQLGFDALEDPDIVEEMAEGVSPGQYINPFSIRDEDPDITFIALDIGVMYYTGIKGTRFGVSVRNFSQEKRYYGQDFPLPFEMRFGVATDILQIIDTWGLRKFAPELLGEGKELLFITDFNHQRDYSPRLHMGFEYMMRDLLAVRGGYKFNYDEEGLTYGLGLKLRGVRLDYAYAPFGIFSDVQKISVGYSF